MHIFAIVNQKGGCGKTTTAINLAGVFASRGKRTLLVDLDPQGHCAAGLAIPEQRIDRTIGDAMLAADDAPLDTDRLLWRVSRNLDLAPSTVRLATLEAARGELATRPDADKRLTGVLARLKSLYDVCVIDCSPAIGMLTFNALVAANELIIPVETGFFALHGATKQITTIKAVGKKLGVTPAYRLLATMHDPNSVLCRDLLDELKRRFPERVIPVVVRMDPSLRESASYGQPVIEYSRESNGAQDYSSLASWLSVHSLGESPTLHPPTPTADSTPAIHVKANAVQQMLASPPAPSSPPPPASVDPAAERSAHAGLPVPSLTSLLTPLSHATSSPVAVAERIENSAAPPVPPAPVPAFAFLANRAADLVARARKLHARAAPVVSSTTADASPAPAYIEAKPIVAFRVQESAHTSTATASAEPQFVPAITGVSRSAPFGARPTPHGVEFVQPASVGKHVAIAGEFNDWTPDRTPLSHNARLGRFEALVPMDPGASQYRLVVDGRWAADPFNPATAHNPFGGVNSVVFVPPPGAWDSVDQPITDQRQQTNGGGE